MLIVTNYSNKNFTSRPIKYPNISRQQVKTLLDQGKKNCEIAEILNVDKSWLNNTLMRWGLLSVRRQEKQEKIKTIQTLYKKGFDREEIYTKTKFPYKLIDKVIEDCNKNLDDKKLIEKIMKKLNIKSDAII